MALVFILAAINFRKSAKRAKGVDRQRVDLVYFGIGASFVWGMIMSAAIPYFSPNSSASKYGPFGLLFLTAAIFYSLTKHKMFDLRGVVLRSMAFIVTQVVLIGGYIAVVILFAALFFHDDFSMRDAIFAGIIALFISTTLPYLVQYFRKLTKTLFFTDSYITQEVINILTRELVGTIELEQLSKKALDTLNQAIRSRSAVMVTKIESEKNAFNQINVGAKLTIHSELLDLWKSTHSEVFIADSENEDREIALKMTQEGVSLAVRLHSHDKLIGFLCFSEKLSGRLFSDQDIKLVQIASNEVALALQNAQRYSEIELFNETLKQKITDATHELRKTNEKLKALDEAKDEFISMASHQLRTPLTSVKGYVSMVLDGDVGKITADQRELLEQAYGSSQRMVYLIADLLNVSRLRTGKFVIQAAPTQLADVIETEVHQLKETAKMHDLVLTYEKPADFPVINIDEMKTRQVIMNFIDNAIYYTPSGGHIRIELKATDKVIEYRVIDDGLGVPRSEQHHLFTKFYRAGNARKARPDGTGLGLFMAKKVVVAQGGSIIFESEEGKGSTFGFSLPRSAVTVKK